MERSLNVWIHCRVANELEKVLLDFQKDKILNRLEGMRYSIIGISKEIGAGNNPHSRALDSIKIHASRKDIDVVIITDKTRLLINENQYQEFTLLCELFDVIIIELNKIENLFQII